MPGLIVWKRQEMNRLRRDMERLFDRLWDDFRVPSITRGTRQLPIIDLVESEGILTIKAEIPGIDPEDLDISITDDILTIKGEMKQEFIEESENYHRIERSYGTFSRSFQLPCRVRVDEIEASYQRGVLRIVMPKCSPEESPEIIIKVK